MPVHKSLKLKIRPERLAICRLLAQAKIPDWALAAPWVAIVRTDEELSVVVEEKQVGQVEKVEKGWRAFQVLGPLDFSLTGILAALADPLAKAGISIFAISTYDTDYVLVKEENLMRAKEVLGSLGRIQEGD